MENYFSFPFKLRQIARGKSSIIIQKGQPCAFQKERNDKICFAKNAKKGRLPSFTMKISTERCDLTRFAANVPPNYTKKEILEILRRCLAALPIPFATCTTTSLADFLGWVHIPPSAAKSAPIAALRFLAFAEAVA